MLWFFSRKKAVVAPSTTKAQATASSRRPLARHESAMLGVPGAHPATKPTAANNAPTTKPLERTASLRTRRAAARRGNTHEARLKAHNSALFAARRAVLRAQSLAGAFTSARGRAETDAAQLAEFAAARASPEAAEAFRARADAQFAADVVRCKAEAAARKAGAREIDAELFGDEEEELRACDSVLGGTRDSFVAECVRGYAKERLREAQDAEAVAEWARVHEQKRLAAERDRAARAEKAAWWQARLARHAEEKAQRAKEARRARASWVFSDEARKERQVRHEEYRERLANLRRTARSIIERSRQKKERLAAEQGVPAAAEPAPVPVTPAPVAPMEGPAPAAETIPATENVSAADYSPAAEPAPVVDEREASRQRFNDMLQLINEEKSPLLQMYGFYKWKWDYLKAGLIEPGTIAARDLPWPLESSAIGLLAETEADGFAARFEAAVSEFVLYEQRPGYAGMSRRQRVKDELMRWHPDKFVASYLQVVCVHEREEVAKAVHALAVSLTGMLRSG